MKKTRKIAGFYFVLGFLVALALFSIINSNDKYLLKLKGEFFEGEANVVAVTNAGNGVLGNVSVEVKKGKGDILVNTNPFLEPDTQLSANIAVDVAKEITALDLKDRDIIFDFNVDGSQIVGGPSAGAAMTLALISALENKTVREDIVVTGTILPDGRIGFVGGIPEKAEISNELGIKDFFVPNGQGVFRYYEKEITKRDIGRGITIYNTSYVPHEIDLIDYYNKESKMNVKEVGTISDLLSEVF